MQVDNSLVNRIILFTILLGVNFSYIVRASVRDSVMINSFIFYTDDSIPLISTLYVPSQMPLKKIVIKLESIDNSFTHPDFSLNGDTICHEMILRLVSSGTGVFLLSPRYEKTLANVDRIKTQSAETLARDAIHAYTFLRTVKKIKVPIGVMGYSATGIAAAKAVAQDIRFNFALLIVTPSTPSLDEIEYKLEQCSNDFLLPYDKPLIEQFRLFFPSTGFIYKGQSYKNENKALLDKNFQDCVWNCLYSIHHEIFPKYNNCDSIQYYASNSLKTLFHTESVTKKVELNLTGISQKCSVDDYIDTLLIPLWYSPQEIDYRKWDPEDYYPKIQCPVFMLFAEKDMNINVNGSVENVYRIIREYGKQNFTVRIVKDMGHSFFIESQVQVEERGGRIKWFKRQSRVLFQEITDWLRNI